MTDWKVTHEAMVETREVDVCADYWVAECPPGSPLGGFGSGGSKPPPLMAAFSSDAVLAVKMTWVTLPPSRFAWCCPSSVPDLRDLGASERDRGVREGQTWRKA